MMMDDIKITDSPIYVCEVCDKFFYDRSLLDLHYKVHKEYACPRCHKQFNVKDQLINHTRLNSCKQRFACEFCKKTFDDDNQMKCHLITHDEARNYICGVCQKAFRYRHVLVIHSNVCHPDRKRYMCDFCREPFSSKSKLKLHIKEHKKEINCDNCKTSFSDGKASEIHSCKINKKPIKNDSCKIYKKSIKNDSCKSEKNPIKIPSCNADKKQYICNICTKAFKVKSSLTRHSQQHVCNGRSEQSNKKKRISIESLEKK